MVVFKNFLLLSIFMKLRFKKGDILKGSHTGFNQAKHRIIYLSGDVMATFIGAIMTHSPNYGNILMDEEHFQKKDDEGNYFQFKYEKTHLVKAKLLKPGNEWGPFVKVGKLTDSGIEFVESQIYALIEKDWNDFVKDSKLI